MNNTPTAAAEGFLGSVATAEEVASLADLLRANPGLPWGDVWRLAYPGYGPFPHGDESESRAWDA